jgi:hypothetical protein
MMDATKNSDLDPTKILTIVLLAAIIAFGGGLMCGRIMAEHKIVGAITLWPLGAVAGYFGRKIVQGPNRTAGLLLCGGCVLAWLVADTAWIRWDTVQGEQGWATAIHLLPTFFREYWLLATLTGISTLAGILSIQQQFSR